MEGMAPRGKEGKENKADSGADAPDQCPEQNEEGKAEDAALHKRR